LEQRIAHAQRLCYVCGRLSVLGYAAYCLDQKGRIILGSLPFIGWYFCFHDKGKLLSPCPFLPDHLSEIRLPLGARTLS
jgi:hypothetical protein